MSSSASILSSPNLSRLRKLRSTMDSTDFEYVVSPRRYSTSLLSAKLTCLEVRTTKIICLSNNETSSFSLPDQTTILQSGFIPLTEPKSSTNTQNHRVTRSMTKRSKTTTNNNSLNFASFSQILHRFGLSNNSTILCDIEEAIRSSSLRGNKGLVDVKIWKTITNVYEIDHVTDKSVIERLLSKQSIRVFKYNCTAEEEKECVICMEAYTQGSLLAKLACDHAFHGVCINKWLHVNHQCPMCRFPVST